MSKIFISYKRVDKRRVFEIKREIETRTGGQCWIDVDGIESDAQFVSVIMRAINDSELFLFMYSKEHTFINDYDNDWTVREIMFAKKKGKRIVFLNIDGSELTDWFEFMFGIKQQVNLCDSLALERLCSDIIKWTSVDDSTNGQLEDWQNLLPYIRTSLFGFVDKSGHEVIPCKYDYTNCFSEGLALVVLNDKYGFIDKNGREVIPCKYEYAEDFNKGLAFVELDGFNACVDKFGNCTFD